MFASVVLLFCADMQEMPMVYAISAMMIRLVICETVDDVEFCDGSQWPRAVSRNGRKCLVVKCGYVWGSSSAAGWSAQFCAEMAGVWRRGVIMAYD